MVAVQSGKLLHHLLLAVADGGVAQVVVLVLCPAGTHEDFHAEACGGIHDGIHRAFTAFRIDVGHQSGGVVGTTFIRHSHEDEVLHAHLVQFLHFPLPQFGVGTVRCRGVGVLVPHVLVSQVYPCAGDGLHRSLLAKAARRTEQAEQQEEKISKGHKIVIND